jgi:hypothetical protein
MVRIVTCSLLLAFSIPALCAQTPRAESVNEVLLRGDIVANNIQTAI